MGPPALAINGTKFFTCQSFVNYGNSWSQLPLQTGVEFSAGDTPFSSDAQSARDILENDFGWMITDGGLIEYIGKRMFPIKKDF